jgi:hypothetical protein
MSSTASVTGACQDATRLAQLLAEPTRGRALPHPARGPQTRASGLVPNRRPAMLAANGATRSACWSRHSGASASPSRATANSGVIVSRDRAVSLRRSQGDRPSQRGPEAAGRGDLSHQRIDDLVQQGDHRCERGCDSRDSLNNPPRAAPGARATPSPRGGSVRTGRGGTHTKHLQCLAEGTRFQRAQPVRSSGSMRAHPRGRSSLPAFDTRAGYVES